MQNVYYFNKLFKNKVTLDLEIYIYIFSTLDILILKQSHFIKNYKDHLKKIENIYLFNMNFSKRIF